MVSTLLALVMIYLFATTLIDLFDQSVDSWRRHREWKRRNRTR